MHNRYPVVGLLAFVAIFASICYYFYDLNQHQAEAELKLREIARREKAEIDVTAVAIIGEIESEEKYFPNRDLAGVCIGTFIVDEEHAFGDPSPGLLVRLQASRPQVRPYSLCRSLNEYLNPFYLVSDPYWESEKRIDVMVTNRYSIVEPRGVSEVYYFNLLNGHWVLEKHWPGPPQ